MVLPIKLDPGAILPTRAHDTDAGLDLYAAENGIVYGNSARTFHTGVRLELPVGTAGVLLPKSGMMVHHDILSFGVIDESYRGEVMVRLFNMREDRYEVRKGDKIGQMLIIPVIYANPQIVDALSFGEREENGFGSTGR